MKNDYASLLNIVNGSNTVTAALKYYNRMFGTRFSHEKLLPKFWKLHICVSFIKICWVFEKIRLKSETLLVLPARLGTHSAWYHARLCIHLTWPTSLTSTIPSPLQQILEHRFKHNTEGGIHDRDHTGPSLSGNVPPRWRRHYCSL